LENLLTGFFKCDNSFRLITEKPSIDLSRIKDITVRAGENIKIALPIKGWPVPTASWQVGDKDIYKDDRNNIEVCITVLHDCVRYLHIKYGNYKRLLC